MKRVRMLLRVSSNQQLEADGDLTIQRQLVKEYIEKFDDWKLDNKEYFEGSNSGYKNSVTDRDVLQEALEDARKHEYDILAVYKDDRIGRRMWEIGAYVMQLKNLGVDIYTVKDGCISPENDDIMGQMILALRYGNAQKSSSDTGMRVKDTAQKLVQKGKFLGGSAPYGYELYLSGEISKHGRALHALRIHPERAKVLKHIFDLAYYKEFGSSKIAQILNKDDYYRSMAPNGVWKSGTITSILTNPISTGRTAYKRREKINGKFHRLSNEEWIIAETSNPDIRIIEDFIWEGVQEKRERRTKKYLKKDYNESATVIHHNNGTLALIDVLYCGYCGRKMTNGSKYNYWTIKSTGERRTSKTPIYRCQAVREGELHAPVSAQYKAEEIEQIVFEQISTYISSLQDNVNAFKEIKEINAEKQRAKEVEIQKDTQELHKIQSGIDIMEEKLPLAMTGDYVLTLEELASAIRKQKEKLALCKEKIEQKEEQLKQIGIDYGEWKELEKNIPTWKEIFYHADVPTKRVLVNKLIEKISITDEQIVITFKINLDDFLKRRTISDSDTAKHSRVHYKRTMFLKEVRVKWGLK